MSSLSLPPRAGICLRTLGSFKRDGSIYYVLLSAGIVLSHRSDNICLTREPRNVAGRETQIDAGRATNSPTDVKPTDPAHFLCRDPSTASWRASRPVRICIIEIRARLCAKSARSEAKPDHKTRRRRSNKTPRLCSCGDGR